MSDQGLLHRKAGPLTYGEWCLITAAGFGIRYFIKNRKAKATIAANTTVESASALTPTVGDSYLANVASDPISTTNAAFGPPISSTPVTYNSNTDWSYAAEQFLQSQGFNPGNIENTLAAWMAGSPISPNQIDMLGKAIRNLGSPPGGPIGFNTTPPPSTTTMPSPTGTPAPVTTTKITYYKVVKGDNWITVAAKFGETEPQLLALNSSRGPSALLIGETLRVS